MYVDILFGVSHFHIEVFMELKKKKGNRAHCLIHFITTLFCFTPKHKFVFMAKIKELDKQFPSGGIYPHSCDTTQMPSPLPSHQRDTRPK